MDEPGAWITQAHTGNRQHLQGLAEGEEKNFQGSLRECKMGLYAQYGQVSQIMRMQELAVVGALTDTCLMGGKD